MKSPGDRSAECDRQQSRWQAKRQSDSGRVPDKEDEKGHDREHRLLEYLEDKAEGHVDERDPSQRAEEGGARRVPSDPAAEECGADLKRAPQKAGEKPHVVGKPPIVARDVYRSHDEVNVRDEARDR
jgi:hypothetical protein